MTNQLRRLRWTPAPNIPPTPTIQAKRLPTPTIHARTTPTATSAVIAVIAVIVAAVAGNMAPADAIRMKTSARCGPVGEKVARVVVVVTVVTVVATPTSPIPSTIHACPARFVLRAHVHLTSATPTRRTRAGVPAAVRALAMATTPLRRMIHVWEEVEAEGADPRAGAWRRALMRAWAAVAEVVGVAVARWVA